MFTFDAPACGCMASVDGVYTMRRFIVAASYVRLAGSRSLMSGMSPPIMLPMEAFT